MKKIIMSLLLLLSFVIFANAQIIFIIPEPPKKLEYYIIKLDSYEKLANKIDDMSIYSMLRFKKDEIKFKLEELSEFDRKIFLLTSAEKLYYILEDLNENWKKDLEKAPDIAEVDLASKKDIKNSLEKLKDIRQNLVNKWKENSTNLFKTHSDKFTAREKNQYLNFIERCKNKLN